MTKEAAEGALNTAAAVLDTNAALDVLAFKDARAAPLAAALANQQLVWLASAYMRQELEFVLARPALSRYEFNQAAILAAYDAATHRRPDGPAHARLNCRDQADQPFINLAMSQRARWLVSSDRDLLVLAKRARALGLLIVSAQAWSASKAAG